MPRRGIRDRPVLGIRRPLRNRGEDDGAGGRHLSRGPHGGLCLRCRRGMRALTFALIALFVLVAPAAPLADRGAGAARGGVEWLGPKPPAQPRRVISLAPSLTDTAVALGKAPLL